MTGPRTLKVRRKMIRFVAGLNNFIAPLTPGARPTYIVGNARPDKAVCRVRGKCASTREPKGKIGDIFKLGLLFPHAIPREIEGFESDGSSSRISVACKSARLQYSSPSCTESNNLFTVS